MKKFRYFGVVAAFLAVVLALAGCGKGQQQQGEVDVNTFKIAASDTQIPESFNGTVIAQNSVAVHARVSGHVVEKYVKGGQYVTKGQPLYRLDSRQYEADLASAQATAARSNAAYQNAQRDLQRYEQLASQDAIARQTVDTQASVAEQNKAAYEANQAAIRIAQDNVEDTVVYAPYDGTLKMDDVDLGTYVTAGQTTLVTIDSTNPIFVQFSMSESEYLDFMKNKDMKALDATKDLQLRLADGTMYPFTGTLVQAAKTLDNGTGKLVLKASFPNNDNLLLPNMYATVISPGDIIKDAILVPTKALVQVLDKSFVMVVGENGMVEQVPVETGGTQGVYTIVKSGLKPGMDVIVDGLTKVRTGMKVNAHAITKEQIEVNK